MGCTNSTASPKQTRQKGDSLAEDPRRQKISIRTGDQVKMAEGDVKVVFVFGGPGSRKGRIVDDLINVYGFNYLSAEDLILGHLPKKVRNVSKLETTKDICDFVRDDPSHISLEWVLTLIVNHIEANPNGAYLVDIMPNLKWLMRIETFSKECKDEIKAFEDRFKVSFALNLAIPADKAIKNKEIHCAKHPGANSKLKKEGGQSDEADSGRTQKRAALHEECAKPWLQYFESGQRLVTIDVSCGSADPIWYKVNQLFVELKFRPHRMANTVIIFSFDGSEFDQVNTMEKYAMERVSLRSIVEEPYAPVDRLLSALCKHIDCSAQTINSFAVDLQETAINKNSVQKFDKIITFLELEQCTLSKYAPSTPVKGSIFSKPYKAAMSTENEICLFPYDIDNELCKRITMGLSHTRKL